MKQIITNENEILDVPSEIYNELKELYLTGVWMTIVTFFSKTYIVILPNNFS